MEADWGAIATLAAGVLALIAAFLVAQKQAEILKGQQKTLDKQIEIDAQLREQDIKLRLMERRSAVIQGLRDVQSEFLTAMELNEENDVRLWKLTQEAELIFPRDACKLLAEIIDLHFRAGVKRRRSHREQGAGNASASDSSFDDAMELEQVLFAKFPEALNSLIEHSAVRL